jgi:predicted nucleic acid-binding protein
LARAFPSERTLAIDELFLNVAQHGAWTPTLWRIEVANTLNVGIRRKRIDADDRRRVLADLSTLPIFLDAESDRHCWSQTLKLADRQNLTVYDASYHELALRRSLPLATLDTELRRAAQAEGVALLGM